MVDKYFKDDEQHNQETKVEEQDLQNKDQNPKNEDQEHQNKDPCDEFDCTFKRICFYDDLMKCLQVMDIFHTFWMMVEDEFEVSNWTLLLF